jgi:hypothetical protein
MESNIETNFIIVTPGRTGSHWIRSILTDLCSDLYGGFNKDDIYVDDSPPVMTTIINKRKILHTHDLKFLTEYASQSKDSCVLINSRRSNRFEATISHLIANKTNEYFWYTTTPVEPFRIDPIEFYRKHVNHKIYEMRINKFITPLYSRVVDVYYEDLLSSPNAEKFIADLTGIPYSKTTEGFAQSDALRNPRNYGTMILNWRELAEFAYLIDSIPFDPAYINID